MLPAETGPDPSPYDRVTARADWVSPAGRHLAFCLLGREGEARARVIAVYEVGTSGSRRVFQDLERGFNPWTIVVAELDGDSLPEIAVGAYKPAPFDPTPRNRLLIFDWTENDTLFPKWLGSRLGWPFTAFGFARSADGLDRLLTIEHAGRERLVLRQYHWNGFGFTQDQDLLRVANPPDYDAALNRLVARLRELTKKGVEP